MNGRRIMSLSAKGLTRMGIRYHEDQKVRAQLLRWDAACFLGARCGCGCCCWLLFLSL